jgi:endonuclease/exonuclease/phosphatase (EEP) superfamily protein YafD
MDTIDRATAQSPVEGPERVLLQLIRAALWAASALLLVFVLLSFWERFDACTVVTLFPTWCWATAGLAIALLGWSRRHARLCGALVAAWLLFLVVFSDTPISLLRSALPEPTRGRTLRVVSLNCAGRSTAAEEVAALDPDVVLIQESPWQNDLTALARRMYGPGSHVLLGPDASILARGSITPVAVPPALRENFVHARVEVDGTTIDVISLRLYPCPIRLDIWSPDCWKSYQANRITRRRQLTKIADYVATLPADTRLVVGGDFNCPPRDAVLTLLEPRLTDAFTVAGRGWGATIIELFGWPMIRIDQVWTSPQLRAINVFAHESLFSDHSMVVADFVLDNPQN